MNNAKKRPPASRSGATLKTNARWENVCQLMVVVYPFMGRITRQPRIPPIHAIKRDSDSQERITVH
jgi:hypothetical protein